MKYYSLTRDHGYPDGWQLGEINIPRSMIYDAIHGMPLEIGDDKNIEVEVFGGRIPLDYAETIEAVPVISEALADLLYEYGEDIQLIPVTPKPSPRGKGKYYLLVVRKMEDCIDESRSDFEKYEDDEEDVDPEEVGEYKIITDLKIFPGKVKSAIFRPSKYVIVVIVNEKIKGEIEKAGLAGIKLEEVS